MGDNWYNDFAPPGNALLQVTADVSLSSANVGQLSEFVIGSPNKVTAYAPALYDIISQQAGHSTLSPNVIVPSLSPNEQFLYWVSTSTNAMYTFAVDDSGTLTLLQTISLPTRSQGLEDPTGLWSSDNAFFYVQTYASSGTVEVYSVDGGGNATHIQSMTSSVSNAQYSAMHPNGNWLYVSNVGTGTPFMSAYSRNPSTGMLTFLNTHNATLPPEYIAFESTGHWMYVSTGHAISVFSINQSTGAIIANTSVLTPGGAGSQEIRGLQIRTFGGNQYLYCTNRNGNIYVLAINASDGSLTVYQTVPISDGTSGGPSAIPNISPNNKWLYNTNFNANLIDQFSIDQTTGMLSTIAAAISCATDCNISNVTPDNLYLLVPSENNGPFQVYSINQTTGALTLVASPGPSGSGTIGNYIVQRSSGNVAYMTYYDTGDVYSFIKANYQVSTALTLGRIAAVSNGIAYIDTGLIQTFIAAEDIIAGAPVAGAMNGQVKNKTSADLQIGTNLAFVRAGSLAMIQMLIT